MHKYGNLVDLVKSFQKSIFLQKSASIQPRTGLSKFAKNYPKVRKKYKHRSIPSSVLKERDHLEGEMVSLLEGVRTLKIQNVHLADEHALLASRISSEHRARLSARSAERF